MIFTACLNSQCNCGLLHREIGGRRYNTEQGYGMTDIQENKPVELIVNGKERIFDIDDPKLPGWIDNNALASGDFPYEKKFDGDGI